MEIIVAVVASLGLAALGFPALEDALDKINIMQREHAGQFARQVRVDIAIPAMVIGVPVFDFPHGHAVNLKLLLAAEWPLDIPGQVHRQVHIPGAGRAVKCVQGIDAGSLDPKRWQGYQQLHLEQTRYLEALAVREKKTRRPRRR